MSPGKRRSNKKTGLPEPQPAGLPDVTPRRSRARTGVRWLGNTLMVVGLLTIVYMGVLVYWGDPYTGWQTSQKQHHLSGQLNALDHKWAHSVKLSTTSGHNSSLAYDKAARTFASQMHDGQPLGRIRIGSIGLNMVFVQGTSEHDLTYGPGHYDMTGLPGMHGTVGIAGHRTTYLHPFRHIDAIHEGDYITLDMPYGTFTYRVYFHKIVNSNDWSIINKRPWEKLILSACHPLYSATHRYVIFAKLTKEQPPVLSSFTTTGNHVTK